MSRDTPLELPGSVEETALATQWRVILYNDDVHTFDEVISQLKLAIRCTHREAEALTWQVHTRGKAIVYEGEFEDCFRVNAILGQIELITEVRG